MSYGLIKPFAFDVEREYRSFGTSGADTRFPCRRSRDAGIGGPRVDNQCAVRMSVALSRAKRQDILEYYRGAALHSARCCAGSEKYSHISSAKTLFNHIRNVLNWNFEEVRGGESSLARPKGKGIIFFDTISTFARKDAQGRVTGEYGDHIDFWNGQTYMNRATGSGTPSSSLNLFGDSKSVWFCQL